MGAVKKQNVQLNNNNGWMIVQHHTTYINMIPLTTGVLQNGYHDERPLNFTKNGRNGPFGKNLTRIVRGFQSPAQTFFT